MVKTIITNSKYKYWSILFLFLIFKTNSFGQSEIPSKFLVGTTFHWYNPSDKNKVQGPALSINYFSKKKWGIEFIGSLLDEPAAYETFSGYATDINFLYPLFADKIYAKAGTTMSFGGADEYHHLAGKAIQTGLGIFQPITKKIIVRGDIHQRFWVKGYYNPRKFSIAANLGLSYRF